MGNNKREQQTADSRFEGNLEKDEGPKLLCVLVQKLTFCDWRYDPAFKKRIITVGEGWHYRYNMKTNQPSSEWS